MNIGGFRTSLRYSQKVDMSGLKKKMRKMEESGVERKCRKIWDGITKAGKKADSLSSHGSILSATFLAMLPAAIMKANQTK